MPGLPRDEYDIDPTTATIDPRMKDFRQALEDDTAVYRPAHYTQDYIIEPWTFIMLNNLPFDIGNIITYVMRWRKKNGIQDLKKARRIIDMMIELEENRADYTPEKGCL